MAVDTRNRRASVIGFDTAAHLVLPAPDAGINAQDRAQLVGKYIAFYAVVAVGQPYRKRTGGIPYMRTSHHSIW
jgi:hypothetical protein